MASENENIAPAAGQNGKIQLSQREQEILSKAWSCMKTQPEIDYHLLAEATGMTNPRSASNAWSSLKKKLFTGGGPATPSKGSKATGAGADSETPKKRKRATPAKKKAALVDDEDKEETTETPTKKKRTPAKPKATPVKSAPTVREDDSDDEKKPIVTDGAEETDDEKDTEDNGVKDVKDVKNIEDGDGGEI